MKKYFLLTLFSLFLLSCSKKQEVIISGKLNNNPSPLERIELIEASSIATLPIANMGIDEKGNFSDTLTIKKEGIYALAYAGKVNFIYLKGGQNVQISADGAKFPEEIKITGDAQANNEYLFESQKFILNYLSKLDQTVLMKDEAAFMKDLNTYKADIYKKLDEIAGTKKPDADVVAWKKGDLDVNLLMLSAQYAAMHGQATQNPNFKVSTKYKDFQKSLEKEEFIKIYPTYRNYMLNKYGEEFQKIAEKEQGKNLTNTEIFMNFIASKKEISQESKDYLSAFVATQFDLNPQNDKIDQLMKSLNEKIKSSEVKTELEKVRQTMFGVKVGNAIPVVELIKQDGKSIKTSDFKGKPTLMVFYSSWTPRMVEMVVPVLKEMTKFYQSKMNFALINLDDSVKQFGKTSKSLMAGVTGTNYHAKGGLQSDLADQFSIFGFKLPTYVLVDKDGKIASRVFFNVADNEMIGLLNKLTGLNAPTAPVQPQPPTEMAPAPAPEKAGHEGHGHK